MNRRLDYVIVDRDVMTNDTSYLQDVAPETRIFMGGAADFKVGIQKGGKKFVHPLFQMWGTSKQISVGAYCLKFAVWLSH